MAVPEGPAVSEGRMMEVLEWEAVWTSRSSFWAKVSPHRPQMYGRSCNAQIRVSHLSHHLIIIMCIYHALINALSAHMMHIKQSMIFYTHVYTLTRMTFTWHSGRQDSSMVESDRKSGAIQKQ